MCPAVVSDQGAVCEMGLCRPATCLPLHLLSTFFRSFITRMSELGILAPKVSLGCVDTRDRHHTSEEK